MCIRDSGRTGPYADKGGFDLVAQGMSGLMSITGESEEKPPMKVGAPITDITAGLLAASGILAAIVHRTKQEKGKKLIHLFTRQELFILIGSLQ